MNEILTKGRVVRGWIGIVPADVDEMTAQRFNLPQPGVVVANLYRDSPAQKAGIELRDIILTVNGVEVKSAQDTLTRIANAKPGERVTLTGIRGDGRFSDVVLVTERPQVTS
jgi:S1-C subfamily serine protease